MIGSSLDLILSHPAADNDLNSNMHFAYSGMTASARHTFDLPFTAVPPSSMIACTLQSA